MILVEYDAWRKGRNSTYEKQVDEAETMSVEDGTLYLRDRAGTIVYATASGHWKNARLLREVVIKNQMGETLVKETVAKVAARMVDAA